MDTSAIQQLFEQYRDVMAAVGILFGLIQCFFGYRIFKLILGVLGFFLGLAIGGSAGMALAQDQSGLIIGALLGGIIGAGLLVALYFLGIFVLGALLGALLCGAVMAGSGTQPEGLVVIGAAIAGGIVALVLQRFIIIFSTAFAGAWSVVFGVMHFFIPGFDIRNLDLYLQSRSHQFFIGLAGALALGIAGMAVQYKTVPPPKREEPPENTEEA